MEHPSGTVVSLAENAGTIRATIDVDPVVCARCAAGKGCGAGILSTRQAGRRIDVPVRQDIQLSEGDRVELAMAPRQLFSAAAIVYGLPLASAVIAAAIAYVAALGDAAASVSAIAGMGIGLMLAKRRLRRSGCIRDFDPMVIRQQ